jgi:hypothetical protein
VVRRQTVAWIEGYLSARNIVLAVQGLPTVDLDMRKTGMFNSLNTLLYSFCATNPEKDVTAAAAWIFASMGDEDHDGTVGLDRFFSDRRAKERKG